MSVHSKLDRWRNVSRFAMARLADYGDLLALELAQTRARIMREIIAFVALAVSGLFTLAFFCVAVIASAWRTPYWLMTVWGIAALWLVASVAALLIIRSQRPGTSFDVLKHELGADLETVKEALK